MTDVSSQDEKVYARLCTRTYRRSAAEDNRTSRLLKSILLFVLDIRIVKWFMVYRGKICSLQTCQSKNIHRVSEGKLRWFPTEKEARQPDTDRLSFRRTGDYRNPTRRQYGRVCLLLRDGDKYGFRS